MDGMDIVVHHHVMDASIANVASPLALVATAAKMDFTSICLDHVIPVLKIV